MGTINNYGYFPGDFKTTYPHQPQLLLSLTLPENWDAIPPTLATQYIGDDFVADAQAAVLKAPSSIVPLEFNYLINPNHTDASRITVVSRVLLRFDSRFKGK